MEADVLGGSGEAARDFAEEVRPWAPGRVVRLRCRGHHRSKRFVYIYIYIYIYIQETGERQRESFLD
jgi:hypothetical protein